MKYIIVLGDGMADEPIMELDGKTPLQVASTPTLDYFAKNGRMGMLKTVPDGFHPGSEIANLTVLGYDVAKVFEGRGSLEAASMGIEIYPNEMAMRCNLICIEDGKIKNHSAGHISTEEATELINYLQEELGNECISFYPGISCQRPVAPLVPPGVLHFAQVWKREYILLSYMPPNCFSIYTMDSETLHHVHGQ